jgi:hypothetical protein
MGYFARLARVYKKHIQDKKEEPRFLILTSFLITFIVARLTVYGIMNHVLPKPFGFFYLDGTHIHHLVYGVILLLVAGFIRIPQFGKSFVRFSSVLYGVGAALTLDEFSLLIHFNPNVYFGPQGRISLDVAFIFLLFCLAFLWHGKFWHHVAGEILSWFQ